MFFSGGYAVSYPMGIAQGVPLCRTITTRPTGDRLGSARRSSTARRRIHVRRTASRRS
jgi:hypothetical protein